MSFRVGGWWTWPSESTTSTATLSLADGGSGNGGELRWVGSESSWIPWRVAAAGVGEESSLGALPVARRGVGCVQRWCGFEVELGASIYRRLEGVAVNGIAPASNYGEAMAWQGA